eukprot:5769087-Amphidinium_carterae.1
MGQIDQLRTESPHLLLGQCKEWNIVVSPSESLASTCAKLKQAVKWRAMPLCELLSDCRLRGVCVALPPTSVDLLVEVEGRAQVAQALIDSLSTTEDTLRRTMLNRL